MKTAHTGIIKITHAFSFTTVQTEMVSDGKTFAISVSGRFEPMSEEVQNLDNNNTFKIGFYSSLLETM